MNAFPRFTTVRVSTVDPTSEDDDSYIGRAFVIGWLGFTVEFQIAWRQA